jgi:hypothetical protein
LSIQLFLLGMQLYVFNVYRIYRGCSCRVAVKFLRFVCKRRLVQFLCRLVSSWVFLVLPGKCRGTISMRQPLLPSTTLEIHHLSVITPMDVIQESCQKPARNVTGASRLGCLFSGTNRCCYRTV